MDLFYKALDLLSKVLSKALWILIVACYSLMALVMVIGMGGIVYGVISKGLFG